MLAMEQEELIGKSLRKHITDEKAGEDSSFLKQS